MVLPSYKQSCILRLELFGMVLISHFCDFGPLGFFRTNKCLIIYYYIFLKKLLAWIDVMFFSLESIWALHLQIDTYLLCEDQNLYQIQLLMHQTVIIYRTKILVKFNTFCSNCLNMEGSFVLCSLLLLLKLVQVLQSLACDSWPFYSWRFGLIWIFFIVVDLFDMSLKSITSAWENGELFLCGFTSSEVHFRSHLFCYLY